MSYAFNKSDRYQSFLGLMAEIPRDDTRGSLQPERRSFIAQSLRACGSAHGNTLNIALRAPMSAA